MHLCVEFDEQQVLASALPPLANALGILFCRLTGYDKGSREEDSAAVRDVALTLFFQVPSNLVLTKIFPIGEWTLLNVIIGMFVLDTVEYWVHRALHANKWLYRLTHQTHHMPPTCAALSLYNSMAEVVPFSACILLSFYLSGVTWMDFIIVTTLGNAKTAWDHASTRKGHHHELHHSKPCYNFEQPFFDVWDRLMGTRAWPEQIEEERASRAKLLAQQRAAQATNAGKAEAFKTGELRSRTITPRGPQIMKGGGEARPEEGCRT
eukprot:TRINITY_DN2439_c0_g3_i1.p1 TRINITY_DN2439_c0_g3~~TRINITY_DN2439_c0_g3_i1.p1  ORF type:complete len:265 (+),score=40.67 TRINITY_DN2439_c0_g3_i1:87-881(+)